MYFSACGAPKFDLRSERPFEEIAVGMEGRVSYGEPCTVPLSICDLEPEQVR